MLRAITEELSTSDASSLRPLKTRRRKKQKDQRYSGAQHETALGIQLGILGLGNHTGEFIDRPMRSSEPAANGLHLGVSPTAFVICRQLMKS